MSWAFNATGPKEACSASLEASTPPDDPSNAEQYEHMRSVLRKELERYADGSDGMSVSAIGHAPGESGGDRTFSIWISGKAAAACRAVKPPVVTEAPVTVAKPAKSR